MDSLRSVIGLSIAVLVIFICVAVPMGRRTIFGHVANISRSQEAKALVAGVRDTNAALFKRVKFVAAAAFDEKPNRRRR